MNTWLSSDHHFWHTNIIKYCNRPFHYVEEMNEFLINEWNSVVEPEDQVIYVGDFSLGGADRVLPIHERLNGNWELFIAGNHDRKQLLNCELAKRVVKYNPLHKEVLNLNGIDFVISHNPIKREICDDRPYLFGHTHSTIAKENPNENNINIGVDAWDYRPVSILEIIKLL